MAGYKRKLIEVALPLEAINRESAREKSIRQRPDWLDQPAEPTDDIEGCVLAFTRYESGWDEPKLSVLARADDREWQVLLSADPFEDAIAQAESGISADVDVAGQQLTGRAENDTIEMELGPFLVTGGIADWKAALERERADARPLSEAPAATVLAAWEGQLRRFPVTSSE